MEEVKENKLEEMFNDVHCMKYGDDDATIAAKKYMAWYKRRDPGSAELSVLWAQDIVKLAEMIREFNKPKA